MLRTGMFWLHDLGLRQKERLFVPNPECFVLGN